MKREWLIDEYKLVAEIVSVGCVKKTWYKNETMLKACPTSIKKQYANELRDIKDTIKNIEYTLTSERERLDRMYIRNRSFNIEHFYKYFFNHPLMAFLVRNLIWNFHYEDKVESVIYYNDSFVNHSGIDINVSDAVEVSLWHPINSNVEIVEAFRNLILEFGIVQPFKQAFREVYILTDAELKTKNYSNRMAGHILKQHQLNRLAKLRGWSYSVIGDFYDKSNSGIAKLKIPDYNIEASYNLNEIYDENNLNESNIFNYVVSDRISFSSTNNFYTDSSKDRSQMNLSDVLPIIFSEVMRDIDLFVGVSSVGNDANWSDGREDLRQYWTSYSFGNLSEVAKTRKAILEKILPKLSIADRCSIKDKFLIVEGKLKTYKIHIGSTNILMLPNDQYLCIVPDINNKKSQERIFIPFEGDTGLSVLISKAIMLYNDDKIKDSSILNQIMDR